MKKGCKPCCDWDAIMKGQFCKCKCHKGGYMTHTILEEKLAEFDKEFPELWGSNDGREGYDALVTGELKSFLRSFYFAILKSIREEVEGMKRVPDKPDLLDMSYNHALSDLQALLAKRKEKIK